MRLRFVRRSGAGVRVVPCLTGQSWPKPRRSARAQFAGKPGDAIELVSRSRRWLMLGADHDMERAGALAVARLERSPHIAIDARGLTLAQAVALASGAMMRGWRDDRWRTTLAEDAPVLADVDVLVDQPREARAAWAEAGAAVEASSFARDLVSEPSNTLTPEAFVRRLDVAVRSGATLQVLDGVALDRCGALSAVGGGSVHAPRLAVLRWEGDGRAPIAFVGKGITFDTGGVCIKPADRLWEMRADMAGAAACAGAVLALARRRSPAAAVAVLPLAENVTSGSSYRPGDVLRCHDGTTIEVVDTDAEGRLVLADALAWTVANLRPRAVVDLATLTGSIITALGHVHAGLFGTNAALMDRVATAGDAVGERVWRMPIGVSHAEDLRSDIADVRHCVPGRGQPDACHAAAFLRRFVGDVPWAHLDIAGVESREVADDRVARGPSGFGVRLLDRMTAQ